MADISHWGPSPETIFPVQEDNRICYLKNVITNPNIIVGDYTYYDDPNHPEWFEKNVLYHSDLVGDKLIIGKFCSIASGVRFIMNGANHQLAGFSSYPFGVFGHGWDSGTPSKKEVQALSKGDTIIGNDVWIGHEAMIMPGVKIADGAIIGARSVVTQDVPPYSIVAGNPARMIKRRFDDETVYMLLQLKWWEWEPEIITKSLKFILSGDKSRLEKLLKKRTEEPKTKKGKR